MKKWLTLLLLMTAIGWAKDKTTLPVLNDSQRLQIAKLQLKIAPVAEQLHLFNAQFLELQKQFCGDNELQLIGEDWQCVEKPAKSFVTPAENKK